MFGFFNVNKPAGPTSHDIVARIRRRLARGTKVGHAGTLDPFATGVLVICVGPATRLAEHVQAKPKRYRAQVTLGATSTTDDSQGQIEPQAGVSAPAQADVLAILSRFVGAIQQVPPSHSAVHVGGQRAYKLARAGQDVQLPTREVTVFGIELLGYQYPLLEIDVRCAGGTYIRSLARDVGKELGVGGYCSQLTRTGVGEFSLDSAVEPDELDPQRDLIDPIAAVADWQRITIADEEILRRLTTGSEASLSAPAKAGDAAFVDRAGGLIAVGRVGSDGRTVKADKVFTQTEL